jgi:hypothetical protein
MRGVGTSERGYQSGLLRHMVIEREFKMRRMRNKTRDWLSAPALAHGLVIGLDSNYLD